MRRRSPGGKVRRLDARKLLSAPSRGSREGSRTSAAHISAVHPEYPQRCRKPTTRGESSPRCSSRVAPRPLPPLPAAARSPDHHRRHATGPRRHRVAGTPAGRTHLRSSRARRRHRPTPSLYGRHGRPRRPAALRDRPATLRAQLSASRGDAGAREGDRSQRGAGRRPIQGARRATGAQPAGVRRRRRAAAHGAGGRRADECADRRGAPQPQLHHRHRADCGRAGRAAVTEGALVSGAGATLLTTIEQLDPIYANFSQSSSDVLALASKIKSGDLRRRRCRASPCIWVLEDGTVYGMVGHLELRRHEHRRVDRHRGAPRAVPEPGAHAAPGQFVRARVEAGVRPTAC